MRREFRRLATAATMTATMILAFAMPAQASTTTIGWCVSTAQNGPDLVQAQSQIVDVVPDYAQFELYAYQGQTLVFDSYKTTHKIRVSGPDEGGLFHYAADVTYRLRTPLTSDYLYNLNVAWYQGKTLLETNNVSAAYGDALAGLVCGT